MKKILMLLISVILISCNDSDDLDEFSGINFDRNTFETKRELWEVNKTSNYSFSQVYHALGVVKQPKLKSIVLNNELDSIFVQSDQVDNTPLEYFEYFETIDDIYQFVEYLANCYETEINSDKSTLKGVKIEITYDDIFHYPTEIISTSYYSKIIYGGSSLQITCSDFEVKE